MRRTITCALLALFTVLSLMTPAEAARVRVTMQQPRAIDADTVRLVGKVKGRDTVRIQRYAFGKKRWVNARKARVNRNDKYRVKVRATKRARYFRAVAGKQRSPVRKVKPAAPPLDQTSASAPEPPADECGVQPRKDDGSLWECTLADDFDGTELDRSVWSPQLYFGGGPPGSNPCYVDDPSVIAVRDGSLHLSVREVPEPRECLPTDEVRSNHIAGMVTTYYKFSQQYGRFEARLKTTATTAPGLQEAFWLWPDVRYQEPTDLWPAAGEIDIVETYSVFPYHAVPFLHYTKNDNGGPIPGVNTAWHCLANRGEFNTYTLEWSADRIEIFVNGKSCLVNTSGDPAFKKRYIIALTQGLGVEGNHYDGRAPLPATMEVDYVRVWK